MTLKMRSPKDGGGVEGRSEEEKKCSRCCSRHTGCVAENIPVHIVQRRQTPYLAPLLLFLHFWGAMSPTCTFFSLPPRTLRILVTWFFRMRSSRGRIFV